MTNAAITEEASDYYAGFLEAHVGKDKPVTIMTLAGTETTGFVERAGDGTVTLMRSKNTTDATHRWYIRLDHISVIHTVD